MPLMTRLPNPRHRQLEPVVRCRVGCCLVPTRALDGGDDCPGCGGTGRLAGGYVCGACHGFGVLGRPRWLAHV